MLRVTVEIVPFGIETKKHTIGVMNIVNRGLSNPNLVGCDLYEYQVETVTDNGEYHAAFVHEFKRSKGAWALIAQAIKKTWG